MPLSVLLANYKAARLFLGWEKLVL